MESLITLPEQTTHQLLQTHHTMYRIKERYANHSQHILDFLNNNCQSPL